MRLDGSTVQEVREAIVHLKNGRAADPKIVLINMYGGEGPYIVANTLLQSGPPN